MASKGPYLDTQLRVERLFLKLLEWVYKGLDEEVPLPPNNKFEWIEREGERPQLEVWTSLEVLSERTASTALSQPQLAKEKNNIRYDIKYLKQLGIWEDLEDAESNKQSIKQKHFILKLWSKDKLENQRQFQLQWSNFCSKKFPEAEASSELTLQRRLLQGNQDTNIDLDTPNRQRRRRFQNQREVSARRIDVIIGDITQQSVDAIVNPTDHCFSGSGGVDAAIHARAGLELREACRQLGAIFPGEAKITAGYNLGVRFIIHTVGPFWQGGRNRESELLAQCYQNSLALAEQYSLQTIAFPAISTGTFGFPVELASTIAVREVSRFLKSNTSVEKVIFVCFEQNMYQYYLDAISGN